VGAIKAGTRIGGKRGAAFGGGEQRKPNKAAPKRYEWLRTAWQRHLGLRLGKGRVEGKLHCDHKDQRILGAGQRRVPNRNWKGKGEGT